MMCLSLRPEYGGVNTNEICVNICRIIKKRVVQVKNPWEDIRYSDYETHMSLPDVQQLQILSKIMESQFEQYQVQTVAILGIAGGNGLEHFDTNRIHTAYGIDVNEEYLEICRKRFSGLGDHLVLLKANLSEPGQNIPKVDFVIANLFIEYIGIDLFAGQIRESNASYVSCVIQKNEGDNFVSPSPYSSVFAGISRIHRDIEAEALSECMSRVGYLKTLSEKYKLPNQKSLIRIDFEKNNMA